MTKNYFYPNQVPRQSSIDNLLQPIMERIRQNKIISYFQLRRLQQKQSSNVFNPRTQKLTSLPKPQQKMNQTIDTSLFPQKKQEVNQKYQTIRQSKHGSPLLQKKILVRNKSIAENSKIKKHLVDDIDFDEIQKMLYKKKQFTTRYQMFFDKLKTKKEMQGKRKQKQKEMLDKKGFEDRLRKTNQQFSPDPICINMALTMRSTPRKKFWVKEKKSISSRQNPESRVTVKGASLNRQN